jgi:HEAT repeats
VSGDDATLPESPRAPLLRAGFADDADSAALIAAALGSGDPRTRVLALRAASRRHLLDSAGWTCAIEDDAGEVRREALTLYAHEGPRDDALDRCAQRALADPDPLVVDAAAFALGEHRCVAAVDDLVTVAAHHRDPRCREAAVAALGDLGDERGRETIIAALGDKAPVRRRAVVALSNFEGPDVEAALESARADRDWQVRAAVDQLDDDAR